MRGFDPWWPGTRGRRPLWAIGVPLVFVLAGVLFATSASTAEGTDLRAGRRLELTDLVRDEEQRVAGYQRQLPDLRSEVAGLSLRAGKVEDGASGGDPATPLDREAGLVPVRGPGLTVTLDDAPVPEDGVQPPGNPSPDDLVVHQQDVQAVVNALWAGGAEAMQLMDQRVVSTSAVRCVGNTLILQGVVYSPPFTITAVGDVPSMRSALDSSLGVQIYRQYVDAYGLGYETETTGSVRLPAYRGPLRMQHARVPPD